MEAAMQLAIDANFGGLGRWREAHAACAGGGPARLVFQPSTGTLAWRCDGGEGDGGVVVLLERAAGQPLEPVDWAEVYARYQAAVLDTSGAWGASHDDVAGALLLDVRRAGVFELAQDTLPGARWRNPAEVAAWAADCPRSRPVIVYCVYGHEVGRATALRLRAAGVDARYLRGGIDGWKAAGRPVTAKAPGA